MRCALARHFRTAPARSSVCRISNGLSRLVAYPARRQGAWQAPAAPSRCLGVLRRSFCALSQRHAPEVAPEEEYDMLVPDLFRKAACQYPSSIALEGPSLQMTYAELDKVTDSLAAFLRTNYRAAPETVVGVYMERCEEYVIAVLAAWKAGAAYCPVELAYPGPLLQSVLDEVQPQVVLTKAVHRQNLPASASTFLLDGDWRAAVESTMPNVAVLQENQATIDSLGYVIYSGGSTGRPKGIEAPFKSTTASYLWRLSISGYQPGSRVGCNVFFVWEIFRPLLRGGTTVVIPDDVIFDAGALAAYLESKAITEVLFTPSLFEALLQSTDVGMLRSLPLEVVWLNGEVVTTKLIERAKELLPEVSFNNTYSISECGEVAAGRLDAERPDCPKFCPVGRVASFATHRLVDTETGDPVPKGAAGELWISGRGVGRGYTKNPKKTAEVFVTHEGVPFYRTGDLARELHDGVLEILGRCDFMVKVRGYSIVLGAVESAILKLVGVSQCCVVAKGEEGTDKRIVAYIVPCPSSEIRGRLAVESVGIDEYGRCAALYQELLKELPHYAVPSVFVTLDGLPLNAASQKTNRAALPPPPVPPPAASVPPGFQIDGTDAAVQLVCEEVLSLPAGTLTHESNFFEFGGHSLLVTQLLTRVAALGGPKLKVAEFMKMPTVAGLAGLIRGEAAPLEHVRFLPHEVERYMSRIPDININMQAYWRYIVFTNSAQRVLLTGATGYVGAHVLARLMKSTQSQVFCVVRPPRNGNGGDADVEDARARLLGHLEAHGLTSGWDFDRLHVIVGDVALPHMGMAEDDYLFLQQVIDVVVHTAANVNLAYNYDLLEAANVQGTAGAIEFARGGKVKALHYISTDGIFPERGPLANFSESETPPHHLLQTGYAQTKWVAEQLVAKATQLGLPAVIYRLGNVGGPLQGRGWNESDSNLLFLRACLQSSTVPSGDWSIELTPVDFVAEFIVNCLLDQKYAHAKTFHLINSSKLTMDSLTRVLSGSGFPIARTAPEKWTEAIEDAEGLLSVVLGEEALESLLGRHHRYDQRNTEAACAHFGMVYPQLGDKTLVQYLDKLMSEQLLPRPLTGGRQLGGKITLVTGVGGGTGLAVAKALAAEGASLVLVADSKDALQATQGEVDSSMTLCCNATSREEVHAMVSEVQQRLGRIDVLVNCSTPQSEHLEDAISLRCKEAMNTSSAALPLMSQGHIVNITADLPRSSTAAVHDASKAFLSTLSRSMREDCEGNGVRFTEVSSGAPRTQQAHPEDVARAVLYAVCSPQNLSIREITVDSPRASAL
eukprot:TRINITY_DN92505_c0_g1_i1.p1 TRINITY_DN92505_c0_g1~~TRINITY_DN92505_c0_g1_i1.p1  ORF type:complete len:1308 (+),score=257.80 TRINITY_DN92505_c0_g1_i1:43-3924(+)